MSDRRHAPTPQRIRDARRRGEAPSSRELAAGLSLLAALALAVMLAMPLIDSLVTLARQQWSTAGARTDLLSVDRARLGDVAAAALPLLAALLAAAYLSFGIQTRFLWAPARLRPNANRLHWGATVRRIGEGAPDAVMGWLKSLLALAAAGWILWTELPSLAALSARSTAVIVVSAAAILIRAAAKLGLVLAAIGVVDLLWQHGRHRRRLRMTDQELRQSQRDHSPPPQLVARRGKQAASR